VSHYTLFARFLWYSRIPVAVAYTFFTYRRHQTKDDNLLSDVEDLMSGVFQGSGIVPLMFLTFINVPIEMLEQYNMKVKLFSVDVKLYVRVLNDSDNAIAYCSVFKTL